MPQDLLNESLLVTEHVLGWIEGNQLGEVTPSSSLPYLLLLP